MENLLKPTKTKRLLFFLLMDIIIFSISLCFAFLLRFDFDIQFLISKSYLNKLIYWLPVFISVKVLLFYIFKLYFVSWRFVSIEEFFRIIVSLLLSLIFVTILNYLFILTHKQIAIPRSIPLIDFFVSFVLISLFRVSKRFFNERFKRKNGAIKDKKGLIVGAGLTGERIVRELLHSNKTRYYPIGFLDDDPSKQRIYIHNVQIIGKLNDLEDVLYKEKIDVLIIAIPSLSHKIIRNLYNIAKKYSVESVKIVPSINRLPESIISIKDLRDINLEDLLAREPVKVDMDSVSLFLNGKSVLVTGAAGSIGSEVVRQLVKFEPKRILLYEIDETDLYNLSFEVNQILDKLEKNVEIKYVVGDVKDTNKLEKLFKSEQIDIVFHAAAYKHVPLMEFFPEEAVKTNIFGTYNLANLSVKYGVEKFINISTDKAVNPTSIMGATKRFAEIICNSFNQLDKIKFVSVRFGNVLGSRGSVIPIFLEQIKNGGPVTVTHPEMKRYFMTIPEAVLLVFQAAAMGKGGEVFVLDMGEPVKIINLAEELIKMQGLEPYKDIEIVFTGLRPGEKLFEELLTAEEGTDKTYHDKIFIAKNAKFYPIETLDDFLKELKVIITENPQKIKGFLTKYVPFYKDNN